MFAVQRCLLQQVGMPVVCWDWVFARRWHVGYMCCSQRISPGAGRDGSSSAIASVAWLSVLAAHNRSVVGVEMWGWVSSPCVRVKC